MCFGGGTTTQSVDTPKATSQEGQFLGTAGAFLRPILEEMGYSITETPGAKKGKPSTFSIAKRTLTPDEQAKADWEKQLQGQAQQALTGGGLNLSPEVLAMVQGIYDQQQSAVQQQIQRQAISAAGGRGLNLSDTPIGDPLLRATGESAAAIRAAQAQATLGLRENELARAGNQVQYLDSLKQQRSFANPLAFASFAGGMGSNLYGSRMGGRKVIGSQETGADLGGIGQLLGGVGGLIGSSGTATSAGSGLAGLPWGSIGAGLSSAGSSAMAGLAALPALFSSEKLKDDVTPLSNKDIEMVLDEVRDMPVYTWKYKPGLNLDEGRVHLGPTVEKSPAHMRSKDGLALSSIDYMGTMLTAVKGLADKVERLEQKR